MNTNFIQPIFGTFLLLIGFIGSKYEPFIFSLLNRDYKVINNASELYKRLFTKASNDELVDACFTISRLLKSGRPLNECINGYSKFAGVDDKNIQYKMFTEAICIANEFGGNSAKTFDHIGESIALSSDLQKEMAASLAQVKISLYVISSLPIAMFMLSLLFGSESALFLFTNIFGLICLVIGIIFQVLGIYWMKKMTSRSLEVYLS